MVATNFGESERNERACADISEMPSKASERSERHMRTRRIVENGVEKMISQLQIEYHGVVVSKKNSKVIRVNRRTGQRFITSNNIAKRNESDMVEQFALQTRGAFKAEDWSPCSLEFKIYEPDMKRRDLDNQITSVLDALVRAEVLLDDSIETVRGITVRLMGVSKSDPRVEVILTKEHGDVPCLP